TITRAGAVEGRSPVLGRAACRQVRMVDGLEAAACEGHGELMGRITDELLKVVRRQVDGSGIVVWYDSERTYEEIAPATGDANTTFARYVDSFFQLRYEIDHLLEGDRPRLVVYVPLPRDT